ncbi:hypothetical protein IRJ41_006566 [Triplophysa rosa]|uniref:Interleukin-4 n=1 Tax=Triplophysa rosa TaxID=992332 RepID=A0A9W7X1D6_TRIRA|nr:hypothetical protein IRJ41_006566 [Triplophysa rosa]
MANRIQLYTAVTLLFLLLPTNESSCIGLASTSMKSLGREALKHLVKLLLINESRMKNTSTASRVDLNTIGLRFKENTANAALRAHTGSHSVGCIREAKEHDRLNCSIIHTFSSYLKEAVEIDGLEDDTKLHDMLNAIRQRLEDLKQSTCRNHPPDVCETLLRDREMTSENLEKLRSVLMLFVQWFSKPME